ncbi:hypothetical protein SOVF_201450 [Spinacia oleracea]|nr:hypothetical protein SOVF_201450 [Spinacia oleracea]
MCPSQLGKLKLSSQNHATSFSNISQFIDQNQFSVKGLCFPVSRWIHSNRMIQDSDFQFGSRGWRTGTVARG